MDKMILTIHQPNFMPWYPFFQKMSEAKVFVCLTRCQFAKNGYQNRFNMDDTWYTMSTYKGLDPIIQKEYVKPYDDWENIKRKLPDYNLDIFDDCISLNLSLTNTKIIRKIANLLDIPTAIITDYNTGLKGDDRLIDICKNFGATTYLSGMSGKTYIDLNKFKRNNIEVIFQDESKMIKKPILKILKEKNHV
jgi:hypothetical protein